MDMTARLVLQEQFMRFNFHFKYMDNETRQNITDELRKFLNREPSEKEIMNGQNDINIMGKIRDKKQTEMSVKVEKQSLDIINLKTK